MRGKKDHSITTTFRNRDPEIKKKFVFLCLEQGKTVQDVYNDFMENTVKKFDAMAIGLDRFRDPDYMPKPDFDGKFHDKMNWLKCQSNEKIDLLGTEFYKLHIMCKALLDCDDKKNFNMEPLAAWKRYH